MRKLASIQKIKFVRPIPDADMIVCVGVLGWELVAMKDEFKEGDWCIYFEIDSLLPVHPIYEFLRKSSWNPRYEMFRLKTAVRRKQISQGLALPLSALEALNVSCPIEEGFDLTEKLGVIKYEQLIPVELQGQARPFAWPISITDEIRVQSFPDFIQKLWGKPYYISIKLDGTSTTFAYVNKEFHACGHNYSYLEDEFNTFWKIANRYDLPAIFPAYCEHVGVNLSLQGETIGEKIQSNKMGLKEQDTYIFNVVDSDTNVRLSLSNAMDVVSDLNMKFVPILEVGESFAYTQEDLLRLADGFYAEHFPTAKPTQFCEGIVIRSLDGTISFKVISNKYLGNGEDD